MKSLVVINASHTLFPEQVALLGEYERVDIPEAGLDLGGIRELASTMLKRAGKEKARIVVASPIPALFVFLAANGQKFYVFHNDKRDAKEVPDGKGGKKVVHAVSATGWQLV